MEKIQHVQRPWGEIVPGTLEEQPRFGGSKACPTEGDLRTQGKLWPCMGEGGGASGRACRKKSVRECMDKHLCRRGSAGHRLSDSESVMHWLQWEVGAG